MNRVKYCCFIVHIEMNKDVNHFSNLLAHSQFLLKDIHNTSQFWELKSKITASITGIFQLIALGVLF